MQPGVPDLRVPKRRVVVELGSAGGEVRRVELFLLGAHGAGPRRQDVLDLLEHEQRFLPVRELEGGEVAFVNKDRLRWVSLDPQGEGELSLDEDDDAEVPLFDLRRAVRVAVEGGLELAGMVLYSAPAGQARISDYLNQPHRFLRLYCERRLVLVNRAFIVRVVEAA